MNYLKKIKDIGFRKTEPFVILSKSIVLRDDNNRVKYQTLTYPMPYKQWVDIPQEKKYLYSKTFPFSDIIQRTTQFYVYKISHDIRIFFILDKMEFHVITSVENDIKITLKHKTLDVKFWQKILDSLDDNIRRDLILSQIL
jgi:hypothetical protein